MRDKAAVNVLGLPQTESLVTTMAPPNDVTGRWTPKVLGRRPEKHMAIYKLRHVLGALREGLDASSLCPDVFGPR